MRTPTYHAYNETRRSTGCGVRLDSTSNTTKGSSGPAIGWHRHRKYWLAYSFPTVDDQRRAFDVTCKACLRKQAIERCEKGCDCGAGTREPPTAPARLTLVPPPRAPCKRCGEPADGPFCAECGKGPVGPAVTLPPEGSKSWKVEVLAGEWTSNAIRFRTKEEANAYGWDLFLRWTVPTDKRSVPAAEEPNYLWNPTDGLVAVSPRS